MGGNVTSVGWQVTLCDPMWHVSSRSGEAGLTANCYIRILIRRLYPSSRQPNGIWLVHPLSHSSPLCPTDRHADHATCAVIARIFALVHAMRPYSDHLYLQNSDNSKNEDRRKRTENESESKTTWENWRKHVDYTTTLWVKKLDTILLSVTSPNLNQFSKFVHS